MKVLIDTNVLISAALNADVLLTGDKDFLESGLKNPITMTPAEFLMEGRLKYLESINWI